MYKKMTYPVVLSNSPDYVFYGDDYTYRRKRRFQKVMMEKFCSGMSNHSNCVPKKDKQVGVEFLTAACLTARIQQVRVLAFGRKMQIVSPFWRPLYDKLRQIGPGSFDISRTISTAGILPMFRVDPMRERGKRITNYSQLFILGQNYGGFNISFRNGPRETMKVKVYSPIVHLLKNSTNITWEIPRTIGVLRRKLEKMFELAREIQNLPSEQKMGLGGYRIEITIHGMSLDDALKYYFDNAFYCLHGVYRFTGIHDEMLRQRTVHVVRVSDYVKQIVCMLARISETRVFSSNDSRELSRNQRRLVVDIMMAFGYRNPRWHQSDISMDTGDINEIWDNLYEADISLIETRVLATRNRRGELSSTLLDETQQRVVSDPIQTIEEDEESTEPLVTSQEVYDPLVTRDRDATIKEILEMICVIPSQRSTSAFKLMRNNNKCFRQDFTTAEEAAEFLLRNFPRNFHQELSHTCLVESVEAHSIVSLIQQQSIPITDDWIESVAIHINQYDPTKPILVHNERGNRIGSFKDRNAAAVELLKRFGENWKRHVGPRSLIEQTIDADNFEGFEETTTPADENGFEETGSRGIEIQDYEEVVEPLLDSRSSHEAARTLTTSQSTTANENEIEETASRGDSIHDEYERVEPLSESRSSDEAAGTLTTSQSSQSTETLMRIFESYRKHFSKNVEVDDGGEQKTSAVVVCKYGRKTSVSACNEEKDGSHTYPTSIVSTSQRVTRKRLMREREARKSQKTSIEVDRPIQGNSSLPWEEMFQSCKESTWLDDAVSAKNLDRSFSIKSNLLGRFWICTFGC